MQDKIQNTDRSLGVVEKILAICDKYSVFEILKALAIFVLVTFVISFTFNPKKIFEVYDEYRTIQHDEAMEQREKYAPQIQSALDQLLMSSKASRILFMEYHNGTVSSGGLPFRFASAAFESLGDEYSVAAQYADVNLTLLPFASYIHRQQYHSGPVASLKEIDKSLMYRMMSNNVEYCAIMEVRGIKDPLGLLVMTFTKPGDYNVRKIRENMEQTAIDLAVKLELKKK